MQMAGPAVTDCCDVTPYCLVEIPEFQNITASIFRDKEQGNLQVRRMPSSGM
jgi:hypothetical protein